MRWGGDEFVMIMRSVDRSHCTAVVGRLAAVARSVGGTPSLHPNSFWKIRSKELTSSETQDFGDIGTAIVSASPPHSGDQVCRILM